MQLDSTQLTEFCTCPMKYKLHYIDCLRKVSSDERAIDLEFGICFHASMQALYETRSPEEIYKPWDNFIDLPSAVGEKKKTNKNGRKLVGDYICTYSAQDSDMKILAVEKKVIIKIAGIEYVVKLDTVVEKNNNIFSLEHKTGSYVDFSKFTPNTQITAQTAAVTQEFGQCSGVIINACQCDYAVKPVLLLPTDPMVKDYELSEVKYCKYYTADMAYCTGFKSKFAREIINRTPEQVEDFKGNVELVEHSIQASLQDNYWMKCEARCHDYKAGCQYKEICINCGDSAVIETLYERYNPTAYLED